jgi:glycosidase
MSVLSIKTLKIMLNTIVLIMVLVLGSCEKPPDNPDINNNDTITDPAQYGTPFSGVPNAPDAVIYQVNMRCFSSSRNFQGVIKRLDSIRSLGVNVIYLMPIYPVGVEKAINSPYCIKDYKAVNPEFGTLNDLRSLIDGAHSRGMAVILDWVANHTSWDNAWMSNANWYARDISGNIISPKGWNDVAQLNFANNEMRNAMIKAMKYWVLTANCDGFRCDYSDGPPADFWKQAIDTLRNMKTHKLLLLAEGTRSDHFASGFNFNFGFRFYDQMKTVFSSNQPVTNFNNLNSSEYTGAGEDNRVVRYITNHDVNSSDGTPLDLFGGSSGSMAAFIVAAYMKSVPMIYNGQEVGTPYRLTFPFTGPTINWSLNPGMVAEYKKIIAFRNNSTAIRRGVLTSYSNADVCAFTKTSGADTVFVVCNLRNLSIDFTLPATASGSVWKDAFTGNSVTLSTQLALTPYSYLVFKK